MATGTKIEENKHWSSEDPNWNQPTYAPPSSSAPPAPPPLVAPPALETMTGEVFFNNPDYYTAPINPDDPNSQTWLDMFADLNMSPEELAVYLRGAPVVRGRFDREGGEWTTEEYLRTGEMLAALDSIQEPQAMLDWMAENNFSLQDLASFSLAQDVLAYFRGDEAQVAEVEGQAGDYLSKLFGYGESGVQGTMESLLSQLN
ncbi:MAG: hypothetical protein ACXABY_23075, partial [Candidatus Thorarchaeota archaeon]